MNVYVSNTNNLCNRKAYIIKLQTILSQHSWKHPSFTIERKNKMSYLTETLILHKKFSYVFLILLKFLII